MFLAHIGVRSAFVCLVAASAFVRPQSPRIDLPVTRLSGDAPPQTPASQPQPPQPRTKQLPGLPVTQLDDRARSTDLDAPQRLSLSFAEPANVKDVLLLLVRGTPLSIAVDPSIKGTFVGELKDVTLRQAIESVLAPNGFAYGVDRTVIRVFPRRTETRLYDLNFLNVDRTWQRTLAADDETALTARIPESDVLDDVGEGVRALLSEAGRVHVDRRAGLAQVTDYTDRLDRIGVYVEALHLRGSRQVRLQTRVLEIALKGADAIDWGAVRARLGLPERSLTAGLVVDAAALQTVLATQGDVRVVAASEFLALNNEPAVVRSATPGTSALTLTVVPQISADGIVQLSVSPSWSSRASGQLARGAGDSEMTIDKADTVVRVMDGSTVMVSGFLHSDDRKEVVVLLTPAIVNASAGGVSAR